MVWRREIVCFIRNITHFMSDRLMPHVGHPRILTIRPGATDMNKIYVVFVTFDNPR
jgi:hypothetical protein